MLLQLQHLSTKRAITRIYPISKCVIGTRPTGKPFMYLQKLGSGIPEPPQPKLVLMTQHAVVR